MEMYALPCFNRTDFQDLQFNPDRVVFEGEI